MLKELAAWYLSKRKVSAIIGYEIQDAQVKAQTNRAFMYNNTFTNVDYRDVDGKVFRIPEGKYKVTRAITGDN